VIRVDAAAALRCWGLDVTVGGHTYQLPPLPAAEWVDAVQGSWYGLIPGLVDGGDAIIDAIADGTVTSGQVVEAAQDALAEACGMPWWQALRLIQLTVSDPLAAGMLVLGGVNAQQVSIGAWVVAAYALLVKDADEKDRARIDRDISKPPTGNVDGFDEQAAADSFERFSAGRG
jgi:hypothetical protein